MAKILTIEDEIDTLDMICSSLEKDGHTVASATTGTDALHRIHENKPELIILDVMLPDYDGYFLILEFEKDTELKNIPIIILTGLTPSQSLFDKISQVKAFIAKPFDTDDLCKTVKKVLAGQ